jgi:hypothetical protein
MPGSGLASSSLRCRSVTSMGYASKSSDFDSSKLKDSGRTPRSTLMSLFSFMKSRRKLSILPANVCVKSRSRRKVYGAYLDATPSRTENGWRQEQCRAFVLIDRSFRLNPDSKNSILASGCSLSRPCLRSQRNRISGTVKFLQQIRSDVFLPPWYGN